jgi:thioredoxin 1
MPANLMIVLLFLATFSVAVAAVLGEGGLTTVKSSKAMVNILQSARPLGGRDFFGKMMSYRGGSSSVVHISSEAEFDQLLAESVGKLIVVDFSAAWCMPCKLIAPVFEEMANPEGEFGNIIFMKIDVDEVPSLAERFQVQAMPTFLFMKDSAEIDRFSGASVEKLKQTIMLHFK